MKKVLLAVAVIVALASCNSTDAKKTDKKAVETTIEQVKETKCEKVVADSVKATEEAKECAKEEKVAE